MTENDGLLRILGQHRGKGALTNGFFLPSRWCELVSSGAHTVEEGLVCALVEEGNFTRLYFSAASAGELLGMRRLLAKAPKGRPVVTDLLGDDPGQSPALAPLTALGFRKYSLFERMSVKKETESREEDGGIRTADASMTDRIFSLLSFAFDPLNSYLPTREELARALQKGEISYIGDSEIAAMSYFEKTSRMQTTLRYLYTAKEHRRKGFASRLLSYGMNSHMGGVKYSLWVDTENGPAQSLYRHFGYRYDGLRDMTLVLEASPAQE